MADDGREVTVEFLGILITVKGPDDLKDLEGSALRLLGKAKEIIPPREIVGFQAGSSADVSIGNTDHYSEELKSFDQLIPRKHLT